MTTTISTSRQPALNVSPATPTDHTDTIRRHSAALGELTAATVSSSSTASTASATSTPPASATSTPPTPPIRSTRSHSPTPSSNDTSIARSVNVPSDINPAYNREDSIERAFLLLFPQLDYDRQYRDPTPITVSDERRAWIRDAVATNQIISLRSRYGINDERRANKYFMDAMLEYEARRKWYWDSKIGGRAANIPLDMRSGFANIDEMKQSLLG